ncbi:MAG TPA: hypothetical protein VFA79_01205, partial [Myxococcales bacterium]|nr:hypothetical protein [Myxococcales bacterium]
MKGHVMRCLTCHRDNIPDAATHCPSCGADARKAAATVLRRGTTLREGSYQVGEALGRGGFGVTYRARHTALDASVAIKEYFPEGLASRQAETQDVWVGTDHRHA